MIELLKRLLDNLAYVILILFLVTNLPIFKKTIQKEKLNKEETVLLSAIFGAFGILGTYIGTEINGAIANTRMIGVMVGGIIGGPVVGITAGIIAAVHRLTISYGGVTAIPCAIATITAGFVSGIIYRKSEKRNIWLYGLIGGMLMESLEMGLILLISRPFSLAFSIVERIYLPMGLANGVGICALLLLIKNNFREKEEIAAKQAQLALEIANKTLPYFRQISNDSMEKVCKIIKDSIGADAVAMTDREKILAHVGSGSDHHIKGKSFLTKSTQYVIKEGRMVSFNYQSEINCSHKGCPLKSAIIAPLKEGDKVIGTLKIYYNGENRVSFSNKNLALGLSQIISTQMELGKIAQLEELASKAEIRALQAQINPHFLFNALNTIVSFQRFDTARARELIINLSNYMRYNIEVGDSLVDIKKEIDQVRAYVEIEKARYGDKLKIEYNIDNEIEIRVPSLIIQPIVENSIKHGIIQGSGSGTVKINLTKEKKGKVRIVVEDDGVGIPVEIIRNLREGMDMGNKIGIFNVNSRLKCIYGQGLEIERLTRGTRTSFTVHEMGGIV